MTRMGSEWSGCTIIDFEVLTILGNFEKKTAIFISNEDDLKFNLV